MDRKNYISKLLLLMLLSLIFFQASVNSGDNSSSSLSTHTTPNSAQLTETGPIVINNNNDWTGLASFSWFQGSGTWNDPYIISNITITSQYNCITISNSDVFFIIQNSKFFYTDCCYHRSDLAGVYLYNVTKGVIYNNEIRGSPYPPSPAIKTSECFNVSILNNNVILFSKGIDMSDSDTIFVTGNFITDCTIGIGLTRSDNCYVSSNEIRLTGNYHIISQEGIRLVYSDFNTIIENNFYCVPNCIVYWDSLNDGNFVENNYCHTCTFYNPQQILDWEMLISFLFLIGQVVTFRTLNKRAPNKKRRTGTILVGISLGVMGLLAHSVFNYFGLRTPPNYVDSRLLFYYFVGLIGLIAGHVILMLVGIKLIRKYSKKRANINKK